MSPITQPDLMSSLPEALGDWPRTRSTVAAVDFITAHEPAYLANHSIRSYFFSSRFGALQGLHSGDDYDDELLFLATVLHDIGLTAEANGSQRFEVDGADRAASFVRDHGLGDTAAEIVWDAIALHTSPGIANRKGPEIALAHAGIGADIFEFGASHLDHVTVNAAHDRYPRLQLRESLIDSVATQVRNNPAKYVPSSFVQDAVRIADPESPMPGIPEIISACVWSEH